MGQFQTSFKKGFNEHVNMYLADDNQINTKTVLYLVLSKIMKDLVNPSQDLLMARVGSDLWLAALPTN